MRSAASPYIELRCRSAFSFLDGASLPEDLADAAAELGYPALALSDRDGLYGAPRFYKAAVAAGVRPLVGADLTLEDGSRLLVLVRDREGYKNLCRLITATKLRHSKEEARAGLAGVRPDELRAHAGGLLCLSGGEEGALARAVARGDPQGARDELARLVELFGPGHVFVELQRHLDRDEERRNQVLVDLAGTLHLPLVATNDVKYGASRLGGGPAGGTPALPGPASLYDVLCCIRLGSTLDAAGRRLAKNRERRLKSSAEMAALFSDLPEAIANTRKVAELCEFTLKDLGYRFPDYPVPEGHTQQSFLEQLTWEGARDRYRPLHEKARRQIERELQLIGKLQLAGYFLIVWDLVRFARERGTMVQGRGSAANSAVCYALKITAVDPVGMELLFERFLSEERGEWPDIDLDLPSGDRREEVIQYVYAKYGPRGAAMTANCITYRSRSAVREVGKTLGFSPSQIDRLSKQLASLEHGDFRDANDRLRARIEAAGLSIGEPRVRLLLELTERMLNLPRHLGQHSGGMVICAGRLDEVVPLEPASMPGRVVVQWDKEDCADMGIIKVDLLGLGMMGVLQDAVPLAKAHDGVELDLGRLPPDDPKVYAMLRAADTIGVFQVESRAQMATLPRMKPERFYDLVVEVAIIRPGPIAGKMVNPYLLRRRGREPVCYPHPSLEPILKRTLGIPLFQEQLMRVAMVAAGFTGGQAEELRRAMGFKRSVERMRKLEGMLREGMARNGIHGQAAEQIVQGVKSFALYGFPESHAASFALLAYASAYLKVHHPAVFYTALLNNYPMGFYHPSTLVKDAQRHGVRVLPVDINRSDYLCTIEEAPPGKAVRLGFKYVAGLRAEAGRRIQQERERAPFASVAELASRCELRKEELSTLAEIGALWPLGLKRREALWQVQRLSQLRGGLLDRATPDVEPSPLPQMTLQERVVADYRGTGLTTGPHPLALRRPELARQGIVPARDLGGLPGGRRVTTAGVVIVRQRPGTAKGFVFLSLEDETGIANVIVSPQKFAEYRSLIVGTPVLAATGVLQKLDGSVSVKAQRFQALGPTGAEAPSHDFH